MTRLSATNYLNRARRGERGLEVDLPGALELDDEITGEDVPSVRKESAFPQKRHQNDT